MSPSYSAPTLVTEMPMQRRNQALGQFCGVILPPFVFDCIMNENRLSQKVVGTMEAPGSVKGVRRRIDLGRR